MLDQGEILKARQTSQYVSQREIQATLKLGHLRFEKCELAEARASFLKAYEEAQRSNDLKLTIEAMVGLIRFAVESCNTQAIQVFDAELDHLAEQVEGPVPPTIWYCKGFFSVEKRDWKKAQKFYLKFFKAVKAQPDFYEDERERNRAFCQGLYMLANVTLTRGHEIRARWIGKTILNQFSDQKLKGINGLAYLLLGKIEERKGASHEALAHYQKAHTCFLEEHNWYHYLYVLYAYARVARIQQRYQEAAWYLDLIEKAASDPGFGILGREIKEEKARLDAQEVDLIIQTKEGWVRTRESRKISLRKQYILLDILRALYHAHIRPGDEYERGLSKAEMIELVWKEKYRPEAHDNKLYYNINRLRKLIESDVRKPQYLLSWKEGYRFAPGLRVRWLDHEIELGGE
jgi:DNA-binding winged helix-turn-helix (wHTH) protein